MVNKGFSRRYLTSEAHVAAQEKKQLKVSAWEDTMVINAEERAKRSPQQQLKVIAKRRGKSKKETARLLAQIEAGKGGAKKKKKKDKKDA